MFPMSISLSQNGNNYIFNGKPGSLPRQVHLQVDEIVTPHTASSGRIPKSMTS